MPIITARVRCFPTEDPLKVRQAVLNIFPESVIEDDDCGLLAIGGSLERFKELVRNHRILDSTRSVLLCNRAGDSTSFSLNKQVAYVGKLSYVAESMPLGSIEVSIEADGIDSLIDDIAPLTVNGEEVKK